jgi:hypothetical protein
MGRQGRLDYVNSAPLLPAFKPLPKVRDCTLLLPRKGRAPHLVGCVPADTSTLIIQFVLLAAIILAPWLYKRSKS